MAILDSLKCYFPKENKTKNLKVVCNWIFLKSWLVLLKAWKKVLKTLRTRLHQILCKYYKMLQRTRFGYNVPRFTRGDCKKVYISFKDLSSVI